MYIYIYIYINVQIFLPNLVLLFGRPVLSVSGSCEGFVVKPVEFRNNISSSLSLSLSLVASLPEFHLCLHRI